MTFSCASLSLSYSLNVSIYNIFTLNSAFLHFYLNYNSMTAKRVERGNCAWKTTSIKAMQPYAYIYIVYDYNNANCWLSLLHTTTHTVQAWRPLIFELPSISLSIFWNIITNLRIQFTWHHYKRKTRTNYAHKYATDNDKKAKRKTLARKCAVGQRRRLMCVCVCVKRAVGWKTDTTVNCAALSKVELNVEPA